ncbi:hypothetical protein O3M35_000162 [Rhynocoris fuscipes]|uniref:RNA helicase n=1 Tax=Rhynocoris fuscipes TaxID=488301 RepID=A0AAW1DMR7_9HEMI
MVSLLKKIFSLVGFGSNDADDENELIEELKRVESEDYDLTVVQKRICKLYRGTITHLNDRVAVIDNQHYFHLDNAKTAHLKVLDKVECKLYTNDIDTLVKDVQKIESDEETEVEEKDDKEDINEQCNLKGMKELKIVGKIIKKNQRDISVQSECKDYPIVEFNLDNVESEFIPLEGDLLMLDCLESDEDKSKLIVRKISPKKTAIKSGIVTDWDEVHGIVGNFAQFNIHCCEPGYQPTKGDRVLCSLIRSDQGSFCWRSVLVIPQGRQPDGKLSKQHAEAMKELLKDKEGICITKCARLVLAKGTQKTVVVEVVNNSSSVQYLEDCVRVTPSNLSQVELKSPDQHKTEIQPDGIVLYTFIFQGKYLGRSSEQYVWHFNGFKIGRIFDMEVTDESITETDQDLSVTPLPRKDVTASQLIDRSSGVIMPGRRSFAPAAFVPVKLGQFPLSDNILKAALPDEKMSLDDLMIRVEQILPCLKKQLEPKTYLSRMHSLLYLEEVAMLKQVGELQMERTTFRKCGECLILDVPALSPYTTKLVAGDMLIATIPSNQKNEHLYDNRKYEGVIHRVTSTELWLQFAEDFHDSYHKGTEYSVSFVTSRASLRRMHQAINLAVKHLGNSWLFPQAIKPKPPQVIVEEIEQSDNEEKEDSNDERGNLETGEGLLLTKEMLDMIQLDEDLIGKKRNKHPAVDQVNLLLKEAQTPNTGQSKKLKGNRNRRNGNFTSQKNGENGETEDDGWPLEFAGGDCRRGLTANVPRGGGRGGGIIAARIGQRGRGGAGGGARGTGSNNRSGNNINWNRHGSGYGMHCTLDNESKVKIAVEQKRKIRWFNKGLNLQQKEAVRNVLLGEARPLPYVIFGPPGTGKTVTVVETILQLHALIPESRLLVATPSNSAADLIATRLLESGDLEQGDLLRMVGYHYLEQGRIAASIVPYSAVPDVKAINIYGTSGNSHEGVQMCGRERLGMHRVTVGTLGCLGLLYNMGFPRGHFTHVIVDEAGQATEPEVLIPMVFLHMDYGQVVLAGDPLQLGPVVTSRLASRGGLSESLLARLLSRFPYTRDLQGFPNSSGYDPRLVTKLINNYRSLPKILKLPSMLFYDNDLIPNVSEESSVEAQILISLSNKLPCNDKDHASPLLFHGLRGNNLQEADSHSWYNPQEVIQAIGYLNIFYSSGLTPDEVGIITPYQLQSNKIRFMLDRMKVEAPKVGSIEEFQGQEKMAIIVSVVRSSPEPVSVDMHRALGFVANARRLNVALSRARAVLIILGNPHLLALDMHWRSVLKHCVENNAYIGCDLPPDLLN